LDQKGGQIEYTKYYTYTENMDEVASQYAEKYAAKTDFENNNGQMTWKDSEYEVSLSFVANQKRIFVMIRKQA
jgi:hypothetical protein